MEDNNNNSGFGIVLGTILSIVSGILANVLLADKLGSSRVILLGAVVVAIVGALFLHGKGQTSRAIAFAFGFVFGVGMSFLALDTSFGLFLVTPPLTSLATATSQTDEGGEQPGEENDQEDGEGVDGDSHIALAFAITGTIKTRVWLNLRFGPGIQYEPPITQIAPEVDLTVLGISRDEGWWQVECPDWVSYTSCWIAAGNEYTELVFGNRDEIPVLDFPVPPMPSPTSTAPVMAQPTTPPTVPQEPPAPNPTNLPVPPAPTFTPTPKPTDTAVPEPDPTVPPSPTRRDGSDCERTDHRCTATPRPTEEPKATRTPRP